MLTAGHGVIVAEFFDSGESRALPWARRPQAAALVAQLADPDRGWDAIVIGEYERAFYGSQYASMAPLFEHYGIQLWMPEVGGPGRLARRGSRGDDAGARAVVQAGDHPAPGSGSGPRWPPRPGSRAGTWAGGRRTGTGWPMRGRTRTRRTPRGAGGRTAWSPTRPQRRWCAWMFAQRLAGHSAARITRALNDAGVPCPSAADPGRNPHRTGRGVDAADRRRDPGQPPVHRAGRYGTGSAPTSTWSTRPTPPSGTGRCSGGTCPKAGSSPSTRRMRRWSARPTSSPPRTRPRRAARPARRRAGTCWPGCSPAGGAGGGWNQRWSNGRPAYRCRHGYTSASRPDPARPGNTYVREDQILPHLAAIAILLAAPAGTPAAGTAAWLR